ncbi:MAG: hypothetical protein IT525_08160 [Nitrosomonas sp.]|nr:hypothetical protein [Nitrosomonas sp.]
MAYCRTRQIAAHDQIPVKQQRENQYGNLKCHAEDTPRGQLQNPIVAVKRSKACGVEVVQVVAGLIRVFQFLVSN